MGIAIPQVITDRSGAQVIDGSLNFNGSTSPSLTRTVGSGNQTTWTWSAWVKTDPNQVNGSGGFAPMFFGGLYNTSGQQTHIAFGGSGGTSGQLLFTHYSGSSYTTNLRSSSRFRDTGWYHIVVVFDSNNSTSGDRARVYVNGERVTSWSSETYPSSGGTTWINDSTKFHGIGKDDKSATENCFDGLMSQVYFLDGQALDASYFGFTDPLTNTWKPKKYTGTFTGTNTFYLPFDGNSPIGEDKSGIVTPNNGSIWSNSLTSSTGFRGSEPKTNAFDGDTSSICSAVGSGTITFTSPVTFASNSTIRVFLHGGDHTVTVNGGSNQTISAGSFQTVTYSNSGNATFTMTFHRGGGADTGVRAIEIDGVILKDGQIGNNWTPVKFGGSVALDNPQVSGARPFLNTTQGGTQATVGVFGSRENVGYAVTVYNDGGGNKYYIDGVKQDTVTGLIRGATYTFDTSDSTVSSHPFRFSATSNGSHGGGSEYTNGVAAITGAATTITVPHDAPNTLYYYCTSHSGMGADITGITTNEKLADQYASNCVLGVSFSGGRYQDDSILLNCTTTYNSVSSEGNINSGISTISNFYATSLYFDGSGDYYTTPGSNTSELGMGTGDFTIETWIYPTALGTDFIVNLTAADSVFGFNSDGTLNIQLPSSGAPALTQKGPKIVANKWNHFAVVRESGAVRGYIDGVLAATVTDTTNMGSTGKAVIGSHATLSREITGYLQDLRIYKGIAKYTSDFVVPATSPDVLPDTPSGTSGGSKLAKITDGAVRFDGTGDLLSVPDSDDFHLGTNDFTIEYFVYKNSTQGTNSHHVSQYGTSNANRSFAFRSVALPFTDLQFRWYNGSNEYTMNWSEGWMRAQEGWKHICVQRKSGDLYLYIDGKLWKTETGSSAALSINNSTAPLTIGGDSNTGSEYYLNGSISNFRFINGTAIYRTGGFAPPTEPLTNVTNTKLLCCQSNTSATEAAVIPTGSITANGNAAATNFNPFNTDINTVRGQETGYCTWNDLTKSEDHTLSNGSLDSSFDGSTPTKTTIGTLGMTSGKFYWESTLTAQTGSNSGVAGLSALNSDMNRPGHGDSWIYNSSNGNIYHQNSNSSYGDTYAPGDVIGSAFDADNGTLEFYKNGISQGTAVTGLTTTPYYPAIGDISISNTFTAKTNFGQKPFKFPPPDGFQPLNTANTRPVKVISRPDQYVGIVTYTGAGGTKKVDGLTFDPDLIWVKSRASAYAPVLGDSVRGFGETKMLSPTVTAEEDRGTDPTDGSERGYISAKHDKGFTVVDGTGTSQANGSGETYVAWCWRAGGGTGTGGEFWKDDKQYASAAAAGLGASGNSWDSDPTAASIGTKQGFSIIRHSGTGSTGTLPHGLTQKPTFYISKSASVTGNWVVYFDFIDGSLDYLYLNGSDARGNSSQSVPTSELFSYGYTANEYIHYLWHDVPGLQKFGSYQGNGSADGPYVELGFRPSVVIVKFAGTTGSASWFIYDSERGKFNPDNRTIMANNPNAEETNYNIDFLSNGFKLRYADSAGYTNYSATYVYAAWAEAPSVDLYGGGANAR